MMETTIIKTFLSQKLNQIREKGLAAVLLKLSVNLTISIVLVPVVLIVRLLRPVILIRFGMLPSQRIGHFAGNTEMILCERDYTNNDQKSCDLFYCRGFVSNYQLKRMWKRKLHIYPFVFYLSVLNKLLPGGDVHNIKLPSNRYKAKYLSLHGKHLDFTSKEKLLGKKYLNKVGLNDDDKFVCLYVRDSRYLDEVFGAKTRKDFSYHDYRDANINNLVEAAEYLADLGYYVFRIGYLVKNKINTDHPRIIDYATNGDRSEFLDIYLSAKCEFFLSSGGGITAVAEIFGRPCVAVNNIPLEFIHAQPKNLHIPRKLYSKEKRRFLTFKEIIDSGVGKFLRSIDYEHEKLECVENTPAEIKAITVEMVERLNGTWIADRMDDKLQQRFLEIYPDDVGKPMNKCGAEFLRQNKGLID